MLPICDHNRFYLSENRKAGPKEYFRFIVQRAEAQLAVPGTRILDIGCATGDFLCYLESLYPDAVLTGMDVLPAFVEKAKEALPRADFLVSDIYAGDSLPSRAFDVVFMSGVNYLFPDYKKWIRNLLAITVDKAFVFGVFNPDDLDVYANVCRSGDSSSESPWNLISQKSIGIFLQSLGVSHTFTDWRLGIPIPRSQEDPLRSWTIEMADGGFAIVNGMQMIHRFALLEITVPQ